jgi:hypothetical protein
MGQNRCLGMSLIRNPGRCLIPLVGDYLLSPSWDSCSSISDDDRTLDDTRRSSNAHLNSILLSLEFDGAKRHGPATNQASVKEQTVAYVRVIVEPRGSLCYRMTGQLSPETKAKMTIFEVWLGAG